MTTSRAEKPSSRKSSGKAKAPAEAATGITVGGEPILPGEHRKVEIPVARLPATEFFVSLPVEVYHGAAPGPNVWLSAAVHGDELNGIEIIRQVRKHLDVKKLRGTVLAVPLVNGFGFINQSRYLPDRRDLNRSFPGSMRGSLAARLAAIFMQEVVSHCSHGIDLHTGSDHRTNLPQLRANLHNEETRRCVEAFGAPVAIHAETRDGSLRYAASKLGKHTLLYEAGEAMRFDTEGIEAGVRGVLDVLEMLDMIDPIGADRGPRPEMTVVTKTQWVRARTSGLLRLKVGLGDRVEKKQELGRIADAIGELNVAVKASHSGLIIGLSNNPLVRRGDAIVHLATDFEES